MCMIIIMLCYVGIGNFVEQYLLGITSRPTVFYVSAQPITIMFSSKITPVPLALTGSGPLASSSPQYHEPNGVLTPVGNYLLANPFSIDLTKAPATPPSQQWV